MGFGKHAASGRLGGVARETKAQATVEMAIVAPVLLVLALIVYNVMQFVAATARFDRVVPDVVIAHGVAPSGQEDAADVSDAAAEVATQIERAMDGHDVEIEVVVESDADDGGGGLLSLVGGQRTYRCAMSYIPWPGDLSIAGVSLGAPPTLRHERAVTVDPWRSGVVA